MELTNYTVLFARLLIAAYFIVAGIVYARDWQVYVEKLRNAKVLLPTLSLWILIFIYIVGGLVMIIGYEIKVVASLFIAILLLANALHRRFWVYKGEERRQQLKAFMYNLALVGAVMLVMVSST